ncbi:MAG: RNA-binding transcriptional accessory protein [Cytophagia bacterium]|nr:MAG: RNA-binding transcriptional accessory protein [Runella sp.]TAG21923.1 MAG: RNA-binding transcriptional accessory protein [Cytophagales bacterium]TAG41133.1 MAG: RNA-binding transcriptional accessory protein [Cytophagia bacterium]TAG71390.1 MAG: RNA-binding transcriptional accessory protein [Runella slithyformis]TAG82866.1 MAG: RNA-binding transcriptional accessory protein [Cytophagales bacterium]
MTTSQFIASRTNISERQVQHTIQLLDDGGTVPFIARYRKEQTGQLDEVQIADIKTQYAQFKEIEKRREAILKSITEQGKLTPELQKKINETYNLTQLEDLYLPYKQKRKTRAIMAIEKGLEPLAQAIFAGKEPDPERKAAQFLNDQVATPEIALQGARDIMAEWISETTEARHKMRFVFERGAILTAKVKKNKEPDGAKYRDYFEYQEALAKIPSHRLLAVRRGEEEGFLSIDISPDEEQAVELLNRLFSKGLPASRAQIELAIKDSYKRLLKPSIETEFAHLSKEKADRAAIQVFAENARQLLLASPLGQQRVMAIDPGFRTGCKVVCLDAQGNLVADAVIYPFDKPTEARAILENLFQKHQIEAIAIGNGTAGRETEDFVNQLQIPPLGAGGLFMVSEQGASIYSASEAAREEFPHKDITVRGAVSIGRRLMDPLAELVKIDPKSIGVGQYQHDVEQALLKNALDGVVESCVNSVGVNLNTASKHLLQYVSGLGPALAQNIVEYRAQHGEFKARKELNKVPRLGNKAFEQCAGFLRIENAANPLDNSAVHPESYEVVEKMAKDLGVSVPDLMKKTELRRQIDPKKYVTTTTGQLTLQDILKELEKPSRDPRAPLAAFAFDSRVRKMDDLHVGMVLPGIVTNITAFGAFVDVGVKQDGLVHLSQMANRFIKDPNEVVKLQQTVTVKVVEIDIARKRISLTMKV